MGGIEFELKNRDPIDVSFNVSVRAGGGSGGGGIASAQIDEIRVLKNRTMTRWTKRTRGHCICWRDNMLAVGLKRILELFIGSMGIKSARLGTETIYERPGGFLYIELTSEERG